MTLFQLVKIALDELYEEAQKTYREKADEHIKAQFVYLTSSYSGLTTKDRESVDYKDPATRFAYVYKYVATHGDYVVQLLVIALGKLGKVFNTDTARVTCIGGGPGSDILAVLKYLSDYANKEPVKKVVCYLLDKEQAWADTWTELDEKIDSTVKLNANFQPLDVTAPGSWQSQRKFLDADLFTLSYFVSEVYAFDNDGVVSEFWATLFKEAKPGALFIYDDNGNKVFNEYFDKQWQAAGLELIEFATNVRLTPRFSEQASELDIYRAKFGESPKLQGYLSYRILRKKL